MEIEQYNMASEVVFDFAYGGEVMTVSMEAGGTPMYDRITFDGQLVLEFWWRYNSQGEKVLDYSTFSFQGWTVTRDGTQLMIPQTQQPDGEYQEEQVHPNAQAQADLVAYAMTQLHSNAFLETIANTTRDQIGSNGWIACVLSIVAFVEATKLMIGVCGAAAATVGPCVWAIVAFAAAGLAVGCNCGDGC